MHVRYLNIAVLGLLFLGLSTSIASADAVIKKNYLNYNGYRYYKGSAQQLELGDWCDKKTPITAANYCDQKGTLKGLINQVTVSKFEVKQSGSTAVNILGNFSIPLLGWGLKGDDFVKKVFEGEYVFLHISIDNENKFKNDLNKKPGKINDLKQKDSYRIVDSIVLVVKGSEARSMGITHEGNFKGTWNGMKLTVDSDVQSETARQFEPEKGTVYAYGLKKIKWDAKREKKRTEIEDLKNDPHGP